MKKIVCSNNLFLIDIVNPISKEAFVYQRSVKDKDYSEKRLKGMLSLGVGGHVDRIDAEDNNPIHASMPREVKEEVEGRNGEEKRIIEEPEVLGFINLEGGVHEVHFGILYAVKTDSRTVKPRDKEIQKGELMSIEEIEKKFSSQEFKVEEWSGVAFSPL